MDGLKVYTITIELNILDKNIIEAIKKAQEIAKLNNGQLKFIVEN
jgi:hypothetical protein